MTKFAFISRHEPTEAQRQMASERGIDLDYLGDMDAFSSAAGTRLNDLVDQGYQGVIVVHPILAARAINLGLQVGSYENANRAPVGEKPTFEPVRLLIVHPTKTYA